MSTGTVPSYVRLANDIARQFAHKPEELAATAVANHIRLAWDPRMKRSLLEYVSSGDIDDLDPIAVRAAEHLRPK